MSLGQIHHFHMGNLDLGFGRTEQRNCIEKGILAGFLSNN